MNQKSILLYEWNWVKPRCSLYIDFYCVTCLSRDEKWYETAQCSWQPLAGFVLSREERGRGGLDNSRWKKRVDKKNQSRTDECCKKAGVTNKAREGETERQSWSKKKRREGGEISSCRVWSISLHFMCSCAWEERRWSLSGLQHVHGDRRARGGEEVGPEEGSNQSWRRNRRGPGWQREKLSKYMVVIQQWAKLRHKFFVFFITHREGCPNNTLFWFFTPSLAWWYPQGTVSRFEFAEI